MHAPLGIVIHFCSWFKCQLCILVAGALGGRFDHEIGNINVLCRFSSMRIILLSDDCLIHLLPKTHHHEIHIQSSVEGPHCGLIPIGMPSGSTTTTGLQWDLSKYNHNPTLTIWVLAFIYQALMGRNPFLALMVGSPIIAFKSCVKICPNWWQRLIY